MNNLRNVIIMALNTVRQARDGIYLDTNAWSALAKGQQPVAPLANWLSHSGCVLWLSRMQLVELSARRDIVEGIAGILEDLPAVILDRELHEFEGKSWHSVTVELRTSIHLTTTELREEFVTQFSGPTMAEAREQLAVHRDEFRSWLQHALFAIMNEVPGDWSGFAPRAEKWIRWMCEKNGYQIVEESLSNRDCYIGMRLAYAVLYSRYVINGQQWKPSDYLDFLHAADMAYAKVVVTERNLAESMRQALRRPEISGPLLVTDLSWLSAPHDTD